MRSRGLSDPSRRRPTVAGGNDADAKPKALSVTELTRLLKDLIESTFGHVWVEGEISNFKCYGSGHCYFTLKDADAQLSAVIWRGVAGRMRVTPEDGMKVLLKGRLSVYEPRGNYQLMVEHLEPAGIGALAAAFEALKRKLADEGLFDAIHKKALPTYPRTIALVTSGSGAAIRDMMKVILGRWPGMDLIIAPVRVQGEGAAEEIARAIEALNRLQCADVMIVGRGGGSLEDLWAFNEERVARAIFASRIPVISAVGHEIDFTIADYVADVRAATPSHAGEIVVGEQRALWDELEEMGRKLPLALEGRLRLARERLQALASSWALRHPEERLEHLRQRMDDLQVRMRLYLDRMLMERKERLNRASVSLENLSPLAILARGYSLTVRVRDGQFVRSPAELQAGEEIVSHVARGRVRSRVEKGEEDA